MFTYKPYLEIYFRKFQTIYSGHIARFFNHLMLNVISLKSTRKKKTNMHNKILKIIPS